MKIISTLNEYNNQGKTFYSFAINHRDRNSSDKILSLIKQDPRVLGNIVNQSLP